MPMRPQPHDYGTSRRSTPAAARSTSLDGRGRHHGWLRRLQQHPRAILFAAMLRSARHRLHLFVVNLVVDDEVDLLALAVDRLGEALIRVLTTLARVARHRGRPARAAWSVELDRGRRRESRVVRHARQPHAHMHTPGLSQAWAPTASAVATGPALLRAPDRTADTTPRAAAAPQSRAARRITHSHTRTPIRMIAPHKCDCAWPYAPIIISRSTSLEPRRRVATAGRSGGSRTLLLPDGVRCFFPID